MQKLTREQAALIGCYTGILCGPVEDFHKKAEELLGRPVWTHEFANETVMATLRAHAREEFRDICPVDTNVVNI